MTNMRNVGAFGEVEQELEKLAGVSRTAIGYGITQSDFIQFALARQLGRIADILDGTAAGVCITQTIFAGRQEQ